MPLPKLTTHMPAEHGLMILQQQNPEMFAGMLPNQTFGQEQYPPFWPHTNIRDFIDSNIRSTGQEVKTGAVKASTYAAGSLMLSAAMPGRSPFINPLTRVAGYPARTAESITSYLMTGSFRSNVTASTGKKIIRPSIWRQAQAKRFGGMPFVINSLIPGAGRAGGLLGIRSYLAWNFLTGNPANLDNLTITDVVGGIGTHFAMAQGLETARAVGSDRLVLRTLAGLDETESARQAMGLGGKDVFTDLNKRQKTKLANAYRQAWINEKVGFKTEALSYAMEKNYIKGVQTRARRMAIRGGGLTYELQESLDMLEKRSKDMIKAFEAGKYRGAETLRGALASEVDDVLSVAKKASKRGTIIPGTESYRAKTGFFTRTKDLVTGKFTFHDPASLKQFGKLIPSFETLGMRNVDRFLSAAGTVLTAGARLATTVMSVTAVADIAGAIKDYSNRVSTEIFKESMELDTAFGLVPRLPAANTERQRAVEAIQNSSLNLRNFLGNEAMITH